MELAASENAPSTYPRPARKNPLRLPHLSRSGPGRFRLHSERPTRKCLSTIYTAEVPADWVSTASAPGPGQNGPRVRLRGLLWELPHAFQPDLAHVRASPYVELAGGSGMGCRCFRCPSNDLTKSPKNVSNEGALPKRPAEVGFIGSRASICPGNRRNTY